ncbi:hypothetical protein PENSPDRAFT_588976, partial [Peniophora sp. CONT]
RSISTGQAVSHDAESAAICMAVGALVKAVNAKDLHVFADNRGALTTITDTRIHSSQALSTITCQHLRKWLETHDGTITFHWVPGHMNIRLNELVDGDAKDAANNKPPLSFKSYAFLRQGFRQKAMSEWRERTKDPAHIGHQFFEGRRHFALSDRIKTKNTVMALSGGSNDTTARLTRALLCHAPTGEYRSRFHPRESVLCPCDPLHEPFQSRHHTLFECSRYVRPDSFQNQVRQAKDPVLLLYDFIDANPLAFSFAHAP